MVCCVFLLLFIAQILIQPLQYCIFDQKGCECYVRGQSLPGYIYLHVTQVPQCSSIRMYQYLKKVYIALVTSTTWKVCRQRCHATGDVVMLLFGVPLADDNDCMSVNSMLVR